VAAKLYPLLVPAARRLSIRQAVVELGVHGATPPRLVRPAAKPTVGYVELYVTMPVLMVRIDATADDSFAAMRARSKLGIAIAAMIRIMATTINNSIREKPFCFDISSSCFLLS
jgi:hypothetical protein